MNMDKELYEALQEAGLYKKAGHSILSPKSETHEDREAFDRLVLALYELRDLGLVKFRDDRQVSKESESANYRFDEIICEFTYYGEKALSYSSYEAYVKSLPTRAPLDVTVDQSFKNFGTMQGSAIAVHSHHINQTVTEASNVEKLFQQIIETLQKDQALAETQRKELIEDAQNLEKELQRTKPRSGVITELYSALGNTASILGYLPQLQAYIQPFIY